MARTNVSKYKQIALKDVGKKAKVIANGAGHDVQLGTILTIKSIAGQYNNIFTVENGSTFYQGDLELLSVSLEDLMVEKQQLKTDLSVLNMKIDFMKKVKSEQFDEVVFQSYMILQVAKDEKLDDLAKAQTIANLINN